MNYDVDYPKEPIGKGNPYYRCSYCKVSDPQINGQIENHLATCEYRIKKEKEITLDDVKEQMQEDLICYGEVQGWDDVIIDELCNIVIENFKRLSNA